MFKFQVMKYKSYLCMSADTDKHSDIFSTICCCDKSLKVAATNWEKQI